MIFRVSTVLLLALVLAVALPAAAQPEHGADAERVANEAIGQIRSPYCPGLMLEICPSPQAALLRDSIRVMADGGRTADAIVEDVLARHGDQWRAVPKRTGVGLLAWLAAPILLIGGTGAVWLKLRRMRGTAEPVVAPRELSDDERARLAAEMRVWDDTEAPA